MSIQRDEVPRWLRALALGLFALALGGIAGVPEAIRRLLVGALTHWWDHAVPVIFPALILAQWFGALFPMEAEWTPALLSFASFPAVGALLALDRGRRHPDRARTLRELAWSNLFNPLLFVHARPALALDGALAAVAWLAVGMPQRSAPRRIGFGLRRPAIHAMNWTTIYGAATVLGRIVVTGLSAHVAPLIDPWSAGGRLDLVRCISLGFGGLAYLAVFARPVRRTGVLTGFLLCRFADAGAGLVFGLLRLHA